MATSSRFQGMVAVALFLLPLVSTVHAKYSGGSGTPDDPYQITTAEDLMALGNEPNDYDKHFLLTADIDLDPNLPGRKVFDKAVIAPDTDPCDGGWAGTPSFTGTCFTGVFHGNDRTISHLTIRGKDYLGLFGMMGAGAVICNLALEAVDINGTGACVGGLVGWNEDLSYLFSSSIFFSSSITATYSTGRVSGASHVGGLVGVSSVGPVTRCHSGCSVSGNRSIGGLVGRNTGKVAASHSTGAVTGNSCIGGLVGSNGGQVAASHSTGAVSGNSEVGGLVGQNSCYTGDSYHGTIVNCYSMSAVNGTSRIGGLVGSNDSGTVGNCYSAGPVSGGEDVGGLVGSNRGEAFYDEGLIKGCFWDTQTSGQTSSAGGEGKTTPQMQTARTFLDAGWDFRGETAFGTEDIWSIVERRNYPTFTWQHLASFASCPGPQDGASDVLRPAVLSWRTATRAVAHDVYFGEDEIAVADATPASLSVYRGRQAVEVATYDPGALEWGRTYYWRVDEVNEADPNSPWKGTVWSFTTADFTIVTVVDDFESYTDDEKSGQAVFQTWIDGYGFDKPEPNHPGNGTGAFVGNSDGPIAEQRIVHGGRQAMPMDYNNVNEPWYSEAQRTWETPQDWTIDGPDTLTLYFRGNPVAYAESDGVITMSGSGDIGWYKDHCRFAYRRLDGDGSIVAKVAILGGMDTWTAQAGVMIRENLDPDSKRAYVVCSPTEGVSFGARWSSTHWHGDATLGSRQALQWVKLTRAGDVFTAQCSADGEAWTNVKDANGRIVSEKITMAGSVYIGLCVASGDFELDVTAVFSGVATTGDVGDEWRVASIGYGREGGSTPQDLYVGIEDSAGRMTVVVHPDAEAVLATEWQRWHVALADVQAVGVDLAGVKKMVIGVGDRTNPQPGGTGRIYIDDIRLTKRMP